MTDDQWYAGDRPVMKAKPKAGRTSTMAISITDPLGEWSLNRVLLDDLVDKLGLRIP